MSIEDALKPLDPDVREAMLADRTDALKTSDTYLKYALAMIAFLVLLVLGAGGTAFYAITKERDHPFVMVDDPTTHRRFLLVPAGPVTTEAGRQAAADQFIRDSNEVTEDAEHNLRRRYDVVEKLKASREDKDAYAAAARAELEQLAGFVYTVESIEYRRPDVPDAHGLMMDAIFTVKIEDRRGKGRPGPTVTKAYIQRIVMTEVRPTLEKPRNLHGLLFNPTAPREIPTKEAGNVARG